MTGMTPIPERPGWFLTSVSRHQDEGYETTEVVLTFFEGDHTGHGESLSFRLPGAQPRGVILGAAEEHIDRWGRGT